MEKKVEECFFDKYSDDFEEYFEKYKMAKIMKKPEYQKIKNDICAIKNKHSNIINFLENREIVDLSDDDKNAVLEIFRLEFEMHFIERKESFKLGFKEAMVYFDSMDMLKI